MLKFKLILGLKKLIVEIFKSKKYHSLGNIISSIKMNNESKMKKEDKYEQSLWSNEIFETDEP